MCAWCESAVLGQVPGYRGYRGGDHPTAHVPALPAYHGDNSGRPGWCVDVNIAALVAGVNSRGIVTTDSCQGHTAGDHLDDGSPCVANDDGACGDRRATYVCGDTRAILVFARGNARAFLAAARAAGIHVTPIGGWLPRHLGGTEVRFDREHIPALTALFPHPGGDWTPIPVPYDR